MRKTIVIVTIIILVFGLIGCGNTTDNLQVSENDATDTTLNTDVGSDTNIDSDTDIENDTDIDSNTDIDSSRILIAYFSVPEDDDTTGVDAIAGASEVVDGEEIVGNTQFVAQILQQTIGGDLFEIVPVEPYPLDHDALVDQAAEEQDENFRPELATHIENPDRYTTILLGFPNWWGDMPMAVYSFLDEYNFGAKTIIPFITHGGSGASDTLNTISQLQPGATIRDNALILSRNDVATSEADIVAWANALELNSGSSAISEATGTVSGAVPTPKETQVLYLWDEGNVPAVTEYTENTNDYFDDPNFRPYIVTFPVAEGTEIKGAVLINAGGAFQFRNNQFEGTPVAKDLSKRGYQCFVVNYRLRPYTQEEGALDLARAVRFVRAHAEDYGIGESDIAVMGFSAGGILAGEMLLNYDGLVNGTALDDSYVPDELDSVSADVAADGMIYSFYGRLSVASTDVDKFKSSDLPPTYFTYGSRDPFVREFEKCITALQEAGAIVESHELDGMPHGFGNQGGWIPDYDRFLAEVFAEN